MDILQEHGQDHKTNLEVLPNKAISPYKILLLYNFLENLHSLYLLRQMSNKIVQIRP